MSHCPVVLVILFLLAFPGVCARADFPERYVVTQWTSEEGLPANIVQCLAQKPDGYIWIGTRNGVARFDGVTFRVFTRANP